MRKAYVKPGAKVRICVTKQPRLATVQEYVYYVPASKYNRHRGGRVFRVEYRNGKSALINEGWMRKGWK